MQRFFYVLAGIPQNYLTRMPGSPGRSTGYKAD